MKNFVVVTGGAGFIGSNLIEHLIKKTKYRIISLDNYSSGKKENHINNISFSPGNYCERDTPDPIPNSEVKSFSADGTLS